MQSPKASGPEAIQEDSGGLAHIVHIWHHLAHCKAQQAHKAQQVQEKYEASLLEDFASSLS